LSKYERLARLLKIITLVKSNSKLTRADLARLCEVNSVRTIQRDINSLAIAEVPIYWSGEGYEIMPDFFMPPTAMTIEEVLSLVLSTEVYSQSEGEFQSTIESAMSKVISAQPSSTRNYLERVMDVVSIESRAAPDIAGQPIIQLCQIILSTKQLRINYESHGKKAVSEYIIEPYGLAFRDHNWYLVAHCSWKNNILAFRIDGIKTLDYTGKTFSYPSNFSLEKYVSESWQIIDGEDIEETISNQEESTTEWSAQEIDCKAETSL